SAQHDSLLMKSACCPACPSPATGARDGSAYRRRGPQRARALRWRLPLDVDVRPVRRDRLPAVRRALLLERRALAARLALARGRRLRARDARRWPVAVARPCP